VAPCFCEGAEETISIQKWNIRFTHRSLFDDDKYPKQDMIAAIMHVIAKVITLIFCLVLISFAIADPTKSASERARF